MVADRLPSYTPTDNPDATFRFDGYLVGPWRDLEMSEEKGTAYPGRGVALFLAVRGVGVAFFSAALEAYLVRQLRRWGFDLRDLVVPASWIADVFPTIRPAAIRRWRSLSLSGRSEIRVRRVMIHL